MLNFFSYIKRNTRPVVICFTIMLIDFFMLTKVVIFLSVLIYSAKVSKVLFNKQVFLKLFLKKIFFTGGSDGVRTRDYQF